MILYIVRGRNVDTKYCFGGSSMLENFAQNPGTIRKRDGRPVVFDRNKIENAIRKANDAAKVEAISPYQFEKLVDEVISSIPAGRCRK